MLCLEASHSSSALHLACSMVSHFCVCFCLSFLMIMCSNTFVFSADFVVGRKRYQSKNIARSIEDCLNSNYKIKSNKFNAIMQGLEDIVQRLVEHAGGRLLIGKINWKKKVTKKLLLFISCSRSSQKPDYPPII